LSGSANEEDYFPTFRNINGYFAFHLFSNMAFWLAIYAIFFLNKGLNYSEILILYAVLNGTQTILEIPSGALADRWGRKPVLILGALQQTIGNLFIAFGDGLEFYLIGMAFNGIALAFISGSDSAFIYDTLAAVKREAEYKKIEGRAYMFNLLGWGSAGLLGSLLAERQLALPFLLTAFASFLAVMVMATCQEPPRLQNALSRQSPGMGRLLSEACRQVRKSKTIAAAIIFNAVIIGTLLVKHKFSQPYLQAAGIELKIFGLIYFVWLIGAAVASNFSFKIEKALGQKIYLYTLPLLAGLVMVYLGWKQNWFGAGLILLHQYAWGSLRPYITDIINRESAADIRASVLSIVGFGSSLVYIIGVPIFGLIADNYGFTVSLAWLGVLVLIIGLPASWFLVQQQ
jgi:MFS family permease